MDYFSKFNVIKLNELICTTKRELFLCLPAITVSTAKSIIDLKQKHPRTLVNLLVDLDPHTFRQGYGEFRAFKLLTDANMELSNFPDNRISFVISDDVGYYLFIESQYLVPAEKETLNAISIGEVGIVKIKHHFFYKTNPKNYENDLSNAIIEEIKELQGLDVNGKLPEPAKTKVIDNKKVEYVEQEIKKNPPLRPDHKRLIDSYSNVFQYVELKFLEVNIRNKVVHVPNDLLPIKNEILRDQFNTRIRAIDKDADIDSINELKDIKQKIKNLRVKYLTHLKFCNRNVLKLDQKKEFQSELNKIKDLIPTIKTRMLKELKQHRKDFRKKYVN